MAHHSVCAVRLRRFSVHKLINLEESLLVSLMLASMIFVRASMAGVTISRRYLRMNKAILPPALLLGILLSTISLIPRGSMFLTIGLNLLWVSDDLLSWRRLSHHPGSSFAGLSSLPLVWHIWKGDFYEWLEHSHRRWGRIIRVSHIHPSCLLLLTSTQASGLTDSQHLTLISFAAWIARSSAAQGLDGMEPLSTLTHSTNPM